MENERDQFTQNEIIDIYSDAYIDLGVEGSQVTKARILTWNTQFGTGYLNHLLITCYSKGNYQRLQECADSKADLALCDLKPEILLMNVKTREILGMGITKDYRFFVYRNGEMKFEDDENILRDFSDHDHAGVVAEIANALSDLGEKLAEQRHLEYYSDVISEQELDARISQIVIEQELIVDHITRYLPNMPSASELKKAR